MHRRQPLPRLWMMTDERQGETLWRALERLPRGSGVVFRHYRLPRKERRTLFQQVRSVARRKGLWLLLAGSPGQAKLWGADGSHGKSRKCYGLRSAPAHNLREIRSAERNGADFIFLSPAFPTRSHPDAKALGPVRFRLLARQARLPVVALGGMNEKRARSLTGFGIYGWAAIDAWSD